MNPIKVWLPSHPFKQPFLVFDDWYDFADYIKQENLAGRNVIIQRWEYVRAKAATPRS